MRPPCLVELIFISALVLLGGCASPLHVSYDVIEQGNAMGLRRPYESVRVYSQDRQRLFRAVLRVLDLRGSQIIAADEALGIVSWADIGSSFIAIPLNVEQDGSTHQSRFAPPLSSWHGAVYGAARIKPHKEKTWLQLKSVGRDRTTGKVSFSEGTYERSLLNEVAREAQRSLPGDTIGSTQISRPTLTDPKGTSYAHLYTKHFLNTPEPEASVLKSVGRKEVFPADITEVWVACVDIIAQLDTVIQVSSRDRRAVFAHSIAVPSRLVTEGSPGVPTDVNVIFSLHLEPRGPDGTTVSIAFLAPEGLALHSIINVSSKEGVASLRDPKLTSTEIAAALIAEEFFGRLTTQIFYRERWRGKFIRRSASGS